MNISDVIKLLSGIALFLFGMSLMGEGLKRVSGNKLEPILFRLSNTPLKGILLGSGVTAVIQSSSATSVMAVGFVNSGMMKIRQAIYVILGAILGTSITGWIICLSYINGTSGLSSILSTATLTGIIAVIGIILRMFGKKPIHQHVGNIMMGFAVLMFGMSTMSGAVSGLGQQAWFTNMLTSMSNPFLGIIVGIVFSAILQSASAAVGIVQALSVTGAMSFGTAFPLLMGITIGASLPVLLSALGAETDGKRTAVSYLAATFMGAIIISALFYICNAIFKFPFIERIMTPVSVAFVNTLARLAMVIILAPFSDFLEAMVTLLIKDKDKKEKTKIVLEERFIAHPALAIDQSRTVISEMARQAETAVREAISLISHFNNKGFETVKDLEDAGDKYEDALGAYLMKLSSKELNEREGRAASVFLHTLSDLERISDHAMNVAESAEEINNKKITFSDDARHELSVVEGAINEILNITVNAFVNADQELAEKVEPLEEVIDDLCDEMKMRHVDRLTTGVCTIDNGFVFNDLLTNFERISDHCSNIAVAIIELHVGSFDTHEYLSNIKEKRNPDFEENYVKYREKYSLQNVA